MSCTRRYVLTTLGVLVCFAAIDGIFYNEGEGVGRTAALIVGFGLSWATHNDAKDKE